MSPGTATRAQRNAFTIERALPRRVAAWEVLGAPRLHYTIATGPIASKEAAARYALEVFEPGWHALIEDALAYRRIAPSPAAYGRQPTRLVRDAAAFVAAFIEAANGAMAG